MPVIKLKKALAENSSADAVLILELMDRGGLRDIPAFCQQQGLEYLLLKETPYIEFKVWRK